MIFASQIFLFGFLPLFLATYYLAPVRARSVLILLASYAFYGWWRVDYLALVFAISVVSYGAGHVAATTANEATRKWAVRIGVALILAALGYFKYAVFVMGIASDLRETLGGAGYAFDAIILPIGISFLSFQAISYIVDVSRRDAPPARTLIDYLAFVSLFPQLIAGPVLRYKDLADQFVERTHSLQKFAMGVRRFVEGLAMKLLIADTVAPLADRAFALSDPSMAEAWLGVAAYSIQLLFDFAGYSSMAIGLGLMIGFTFMENFDAPYTSTSITEFWRRWHISLSAWLRDYLYVPLGGNRHGALATYRNLMLTMVLGGLWHGANVTFVLWGAWHGLLLAAERLAGVRVGQTLLPRPFAWLTTMIAVMIGWVLFRAETLQVALTMYRGMFGLGELGLSSQYLYATQSIELWALFIGGVIATMGRAMRTDISWPALRFGTTVVLMTASTMVLSARLHSPFLYFQF
ncbi:MBOAT family O-acyltransferase [Shimia ponticola]|uniref:MBOAT family O-acyltransferase n=1 Tax=Shimia ponticola TaxID=2582893 RepID=UPI0011BFC1A7|nr:MBOAT family protein [Shimia ponticola]